MTSQLALQKNFIIYSINFKEDIATFLWSSANQETLDSSVDLKIKTQKIELQSLAADLGCSNVQEKVIIPTLDAYNRLLVYACVRSLVRNSEKARKLAKLIFEINSWDALYWASRFREVWWGCARHRSIIKVAKAFKLFFDLE